MSMTLMILTGVIWCLILFLVSRYLCRRIYRHQWAKPFLILVVASGMVPLVYEYWYYYSFRQHCAVKAGWRILNPVSTDRIAVEGWSGYAVDALLSPRVRHVTLLPGKTERLRFFDEMQEFHRSNAGHCTQKTLQLDAPLHLSLRYVGELLEKNGVCVSPVENESLPTVRLKTEWTELRWDEDVYSNTERTVDYKIFLFDDTRGEAAAEYHGISTPVGMMYRFIVRRPRGRYSCDQHSPGRYFRDDANDLDIKKFLDTALLPTTGR